MVATAAQLVPAVTAPREPWPLWALGLAMVLALTGCASSGGVRSPRVDTPPTEPPPPTARPQPPPAPRAPSARVETGQASWYGTPHHGLRTASGEIYNMHALTAAHPSLPLGTQVRVTNLKNGRSVDVRVNDRGPIVRGRIIDLSYAAARRLDAIQDGAFAVRLRVLTMPGDESVTKPVERRSEGGDEPAARWWTLEFEDEMCPRESAVTAEMPEGGRARSMPLPSRRS